MVDIVVKYIQMHIAYFDIEMNRYEFLVLKRSRYEFVYPLMKQVVTGTIENNEKPLETALRELNEETGLSILKLWNIPEITQFYDYKRNQMNLVPVFGVLVSNKSVILSDEHEEYNWLDLDNAICELDLPSHKKGTQNFNNIILNNSNNKIYQIKI